ncbi:unnamed protein product [Miscanthus lutarioriparius]|uniref:Nucleotide-diphospho-sugar transferase domain-containing protein n=1 Tax=Miscanthus lutarioriparius TaxID=422564 RepID=A0A811P9M7_9POAL|nr:unnamed protein product [Miscanthus lutarioriparius]
MGTLSKRNGPGHLGCFLLGALLPTAFLLFVDSDRAGALLSSMSSLGLGNGLRSNLTSHGGSESAGAGEDDQVMFKGLAELLPRVAMDDRTVIITSVNEAWAQPGSLMDLYLDSFKNGEDTAHLLNHLVVVVLDARGFDRCKAVHPHCYHLNATSVDMSSAKRFMSPDYLELVWTKLVFQQRDCDMVWFRNPFRHFPVYADMSCSSDDFKPSRAPLDNPLNTGLYYMKSTNRTIEMMKYWRAARERFPRKHDQAVFVKIRHELIGKLLVRIEPLDTVYYGGFCEYHDDPEKVCTIHADCCVGVDNKVHDLKDFAADWKNYTSLAPEARQKGAFKWTYPTRCRDSVRWRKP